MLLRFLFASLFLIFSFSCVYDNLEEKSADANLVIKTGTVCGWCAKNDTLTLSDTHVRYVNYTNCSSSKPTLEKTGELTASELQTLLNLLDFDELNKLELNSCNICVDGCDDWISFKNGTQTHFIRFGANDAKLQPIKAFVDQLNVIKSQYSGSR